MAGIERIRSVASRVKREAENGNEVLVVVSAMAGETDRLVQLCKEASALADPKEQTPYDRDRFGIIRRSRGLLLLDAAQASIRAVELDIARQVEQAAIAVQEADERIQAAQVAVVSAVENFRLAQGRFDAGVGTIQELTDAQLALTQAQSTEAQALADYRIELARLQRALGLR